MPHNTLDSTPMSASGTQQQSSAQEKSASSKFLPLAEVDTSRRTAKVSDESSSRSPSPSTPSSPPLEGQSARRASTSSVSSTTSAIPSAEFSQQETTPSSFQINNPITEARGEKADASPQLTTATDMTSKTSEKAISNGTAPQMAEAGSQEDLLSAYTFPHDKLRRTLRDASKTPLVLVACGSFSPITYLHMRMFEMAADEVKESTDYELMGSFLSPVGDAYKKSGLAEASHRIKMCQLAAEPTDQIMVDPWEAYHRDYTRTALVLDHVAEEVNRIGITTEAGERRECRIMLLAGADLVGTMSTPGVWSDQDLEHILGRYGAFILERSGTNMEEALAQLQKWRKNIQIIEQTIKNDVSSTKIRQFLKKDRSVRYLIPPNVINYIDEYGLYEKDAARAHDRSRSVGTLPA